MLDATPSSGWRVAALQVLGSLIDIGRTRLELVTVELEEERLVLARLWIAAAFTLFLLFVGLVLAVGGIVLLCAPADRPAALGSLSALFLVAALAAAWQWRRLRLRRSPFLHATLGELRHDGGALPGVVAP